MKRGTVTLGTLLLLAGCGFDPDIHSIETGIQKDLRDQGLHATVDCPNIDWNTGNDFHCVATDPQGRTSRITVTMETGNGDYTWQLG